jgi:hypothetical protein
MTEVTPAPTKLTGGAGKMVAGGSPVRWERSGKVQLGQRSSALTRPASGVGC